MLSSRASWFSLLSALGSRSARRVGSGLRFSRCLRFAVSSRAAGLHRHLSLGCRGTGLSVRHPCRASVEPIVSTNIRGSCQCNGFSPSPPMSSISAADRSSMHAQRLSPSPTFACARAVCLLIITAANFGQKTALGATGLCAGVGPRAPCSPSSAPRQT